MSTAPSIQISYSKKSISAKALKVLGATQDEVTFERTLILTAPGSSPGASGRRVFVEYPLEEEESLEEVSKPVKVLGLPNEPPLEWLQQQGEGDPDKLRRLPSKALQTLGATIDDVRIEKALLVLGEAPGREVPAGKLPRPSPAMSDDSSTPSRWAEAPPAPPGVSVFLCAFLPWGILAPLNILKLQLNKVCARRLRLRLSARACSSSALLSALTADCGMAAPGR